MISFELKDKLRSWEWWFKWFLKFNGHFGFLPYSWDSGREKLEFTNSKIRLYIWYIGSIWLISDNIYLVITALRINYSKQRYDVTLKFLVHTISRIGAGFGSVTILYKLQFSKEFLNHSMTLHRRFKEEYFCDPNARVNEGMAGLIMFGTILTMVHPVIGPFVQHLTERHSIRYWGSQFLSNDAYDSTTGVIFFAMAELLVSYIAFAGACYPMGMMYVYCGVAKFWLKWLGEEKEPMHKQLRMYRTLQVLDAIHNKCCGDFWWPLTQNMYLYLHVLINVLLIKFNSFIPPTYLLMLVFASGVLTLFEKKCIKSASQLYEFSLVFREKMMNHGRQGRLIGRSLRCLRAQVASFYFLKMSTFTSYMQALVDQTINVILTFLV